MKYRVTKEQLLIHQHKQLWRRTYPILERGNLDVLEGPIDAQIAGARSIIIVRNQKEQENANTGQHDPDQVLLEAGQLVPVLEVR